MTSPTDDLSGLVERLEAMALDPDCEDRDYSPELRKAATAISTLKEERDRLAAALSLIEAGCDLLAEDTDPILPERVSDLSSIAHRALNGDEQAPIEDRK